VPIAQLVPMPQRFELQHLQVRLFLNHVVNSCRLHLVKTAPEVLVMRLPPELELVMMTIGQAQPRQLQVGVLIALLAFRPFVSLQQASSMI